MAPGSTKSRRSARKFALREDDAAAQYEVSRRKETRTTASGRKKTVVIEESLRNDPAPPPKRKKQKTSSAPAADENPGQPDENIDLPDITVVTGTPPARTRYAFRVCSVSGDLKPFTQTQKDYILQFVQRVHPLLEALLSVRHYRRRTQNVQTAPQITGPCGDAPIVALRRLCAAVACGRHIWQTHSTRFRNGPVNISERRSFGKWDVIFGSSPQRLKKCSALSFRVTELEKVQQRQDTDEQRQLEMSAPHIPAEDRRMF